MVSFFLGFFVAAFGSKFEEPSCPKINFQDLVSLMQKNPASEALFFATWCSDCKAHMLDKPNRIFITTFDEQKNAEKVFEKLGLKSLCFTDDGIAEKLKIKSIPASYVMRSGNLVRAK